MFFSGTSLLLKMPIDLQSALSSVTHVAEGLAPAQCRASNTEWSLLCGSTQADGIENGEATDFVNKYIHKKQGIDKLNTAKTALYILVAKLIKKLLQDTRKSANLI